MFNAALLIPSLFLGESSRASYVFSRVETGGNARRKRRPRPGRSKRKGDKRVKTKKNTHLGNGEKRQESGSSFVDAGSFIPSNYSYVQQGRPACTRSIVFGAPQKGSQTRPVPADVYSSTLPTSPAVGPRHSPLPPLSPPTRPEMKIG